jgi:hypothetical protein
MNDNRTRWARSEVSFQYLERGIPAWLSARRKADPSRHHATQLAAVEALLNPFLARLKKEIGALASETSTRYAFYEAAARLDRRIV